VALSAAGSSDPDQAANTLTYTWDLDGDNIFGEIGGDNGDENGESPIFSAANLDGPSVVNVTLRVTDSLGASHEASAVVNVNNVAPTVGVITAPIAPQLITTSINASATFADAGVLDTHTAVWNWGDSTTSAGNVSEANGSGSVSGSHTYTAAGVYTVTLTVTDDDGASAQQVFDYIVVYNPDGGFVTGGGWINSPLGAMPGNPTAAGKAHFAFVSKYKRGAHVPDGDTKFKFSAGNFDFESTSYDWMVISGAKARYRGTGKVNGGGNYGFQITLIDGEHPGGGGVDRFRIKIWNLNAGNAVVYDNQLGADEDDDPVTAIGGGNIKIHT
jgi:PKD repeat protein